MDTKYYCRICNEEITSGRSKRFCSKDHYQPCGTCGEDYLVKKVGSPPKFCSGSCAAISRNSNLNIEDKVCQLCKKSFSPTNPNSKFCSDAHYKDCLTCGNSFEILNVAKIKDYCSWSCSIAKPRELTCAFCSEPFTADHPEQKYCTRDHYSPCIACAKPIEVVKPSRVPSFCSHACSWNIRETYELTCEFCGDLFESKVASAKFCGKIHTNNCVSCGEAYELSVYSSSSTCSKACAAAITDYAERNAKTAARLSAKYGVEVTNASQLPEVKLKKIATVMSNYGVDNPSKSPKVKEKRKKTNLERYGVENAASSPKSKKKMKETVLARYGVENVFQAEKIKKKSRATMQERYGVDNPFQMPQSRANAIAAGTRRVSKVNLDWKRDLEEELSITLELEVPFGENSRAFADLGYESVLLDLNPSITHSSSHSFLHLRKSCKTEDCSDPRHAPMDHLAHQKRFLEAEADGKILLQRFDWHNEAIFKSIVSSKMKLDKNRAYAKKCEIREIKQSEANRFFKENHLLGAASKQTFCVGLFYQGELVHVHSYGPARLNKKFEWEAIRSCSKMGWQVQGGFSRCDKFFFRAKNPESVISYVDLAIGSGSTEAANPGWKLISTNRPSSTWVYIGSKKDQGKRPNFVKGASARKLSADKLLGFEVGEKYPSHHADGSVFTNSEVLTLEGYIEVYDAGTRTFGWRR